MSLCVEKAKWWFLGENDEGPIFVEASILIPFGTLGSTFTLLKGKMGKRMTSHQKNIMCLWNIKIYFPFPEQFENLYSCCFYHELFKWPIW